VTINRGSIPWGLIHPKNSRDSHAIHPNRSLSTLEGSEARAPPPGQCRWRPEGRRYPEKSLKERLRFIPDAVNTVDVVTSTPTSSTAMDTTTAGIRPNLIYSALVNVLEMISFGLVILVKSVLSFIRFIN